MTEGAGARWYRTDTVAAVLVLLLTAAHVLLALHFPLAPDETYYWEWSRQLDWGYYDQGPLIAWLIRASTEALGHTELGVRAGVIVCAAATLWLVYRTGTMLFGRKAGLLSMLSAGITPMGLAGGFVATYDVPLVLFWTWSLYCLARALTASDVRASNRWWTMVGVAAGLGLLSKVTMALLLPCTLLFMATRQEMRRWLRQPAAYAAILLALLVYSPNLVWQGQHDWITFAHVLGLTEKGHSGSALKHFGEFVGSQVGLMTPFLAAGMVAALWQSRKGWNRPNGWKHWYLFCISAPVLILFTVLSLKTKVQANWAVCGWIGAGVAYGAWVQEGGRGRRQYATVALALAGLVSLLAGWPELRIAVGLRLPARLDQTRKMYGGRELAAACVPEMRKLTQGGEPPVAGAATYDVASRLAFYLPGQPHTHCFFLGTRDNQYRFLNRASGLRRGRNALVVDNRPPDDPLLPLFHSVFERVEPVPQPVVVYVRPIYREPTVRYYLYRCYGYRGPEP